MSTPYFAAISWDDEAGVWYVSDTDFPGLVAEAETQQQLVQKVRDLVPDLYGANRHLVRQDHARGGGRHSVDAEAAGDLSSSP